MGYNYLGGGAKGVAKQSEARIHLITVLQCVQSGAFFLITFSLFPQRIAEKK